MNSNTNGAQTDHPSTNISSATTPNTDNTMRLAEAEKLAADLSKASELTITYANLAGQIKCQEGSNHAPSFVGFKKMKDALRTEYSGGNLEKFKKWTSEGNWQNSILNTMIGGCFLLIRILKVWA